MTDFSKAKAILYAANSKNAHEMLAAQLLAAKLNKASNVPSACVDSAIDDADNLLTDANYNGPGTTSPPSNKNAVNAVKDRLDDFNNNGCP